MTQSISCNLFTATIRVSNVIRSIIGKQGMRLYIGAQETCKVHDHFYVLRCYKCQDYGHHSINCTNNAVCGYCAKDGHETRDCPVKHIPSSMCCINCKQTTGSRSAHVAGSLLCPTLAEHLATAKKLIPFHQREELAQKRGAATSQKK